MTTVDDEATNREILERKISINAVVNRVKETPEFNNDGNRICLDCGDEIIKARVEAVDAVRCVLCQSETDILNRNYA